MEKGHSKDSTSLTDLPPQLPSSALIIIVTKAISKWAALHRPSGQGGNDLIGLFPTSKFVLN